MCVPYITLPTSLKAADSNRYRSLSTRILSVGEKKSILLVSGGNLSTRICLELLREYNVRGSKKSSLHSLTIQKNKNKVVIFVALLIGKVIVGHLFIS